VQQQWLFKQRADTAENILNAISTRIQNHFNYINKLQFILLNFIPPSNQ